MTKPANGGRRRLVTPILAKTMEQIAWPEGERLFYLVARDGLYLCRQHEFFRSCVKARGGPSELKEQRAGFEPRFPEIPCDLIERAVGFFARIADLYCAESAALFVWDRGEQRVRLVVPRQTATVSRSSSGYDYPIGVHYDPPTDLPDDWVVFGDIHCHVDYAAYASHTDVEDELHSAGLHLVVGRISEEPPEFHIEAVVDGERFVLELDQVSGGYERRRTDVPEGWVGKVDVSVQESSWVSYWPPTATS